jgi:putative thioredoxin
MSSHTVTVTAENFETEVLKASHDKPVLIDFWAPWCAPCRALKPILERLAEEYAGRFILAKLDTDELPELAQRFGIRGIPNIKAVINGEVTAEFTGAIPEPKVREFLDKLLPGEGEKLRRVAAEAVREGDFEKAEIALRDAIDKEPALTAARLDLAALLIARQAFPEAELVLEPIPERERDGNDLIQKLIAQIEVWKAGRSLPPTTELLEDIRKSPDDLQLRLKLAERYMADSQFESALETRGGRWCKCSDLRRISPMSSAGIVVNLPLP